ncbi:growth arrest-specific protein 2-like isoform X2 [Littorina saxatilis]
MADARQHPANQGALRRSDLDPQSEPTADVAVNGLASTNGEGDAHEQEQDHISQKLNENQDSMLLPIKEDLSEWITRIIGVEISPDSFIKVLDSGVALCTIAKLIETHAKEYAKQGKLTEPLPNYKLKCNTQAKSGTWFSRDNVTNFLGWCRAYGMTDETMFDSEDLVAHKQEKPVVNCVLELARLGWKYGIEPPNLIRMEREIEKEAKEFEPPPFIPKPVEIVKQKPVEKPVEKKPEILDLHKEVKRVAHKCKCQEYVNRISEGVYDIFGKRVFIRLLHGKHLMVRVGGGWDTFENYLRHHDPIQVYEFRRDSIQQPPKSKFEGYLVIKSKYKSS